MRSKRGFRTAVISAVALISVTAYADNVINDDQIVAGSLCVGFDCVTGEVFGFDTIRLKENNTRLAFDDTSVGNFPANDWTLTVNDEAAGGLSKFSLDDVTSNKTPFTVEAGAPNHSLYVDSRGFLGLGTASPVLPMHQAQSNTPALRFEQNAAGGFTAQTWDVAGNEANFFVRDVTNGSKLPFRIRPGAPTSSIDVAASGRVGVGTATPDQPLDIENASPAMRLTCSTLSKAKWDLLVQPDTGRFAVVNGTTGQVPLAVKDGRVDITGSLFINGGPVTPDYVFEPDYRLMSIDEHAAAMWKEKHLPHVLPADKKGTPTQVDVGARQQGLLEELEIAHIYIEKLNKRLATLEATVDRLEKRK